MPGVSGRSTIGGIPQEPRCPPLKFGTLLSPLASVWYPSTVRRPGISVRMNDISRRLYLTVPLSLIIALAPSWLMAAPAHEEGGKLEYIADHLSESRLVFDPLNLELVDELKLVEDGQLETQVQTPVGVLATSDLFVSGS